MYRIKTDIRQYKCESIDKVEKLIRNWVIRPNDLIYHSDARDWLPIGEHPSFERLFGILEEREAAEPDTVITRDHHVNGRDPKESEVTQLSERPEFDDSEAEDDNDTETAEGQEESSDALDSRETDIFDADQIAESLAERDRSGETGALEAEGTSDPPDSPTDDGLGDEDPGDPDPHDSLDAEAEADSTPAPEEPQDRPVPPVAPEGVEPPVNDEITVMTDRTLEIMKVDEVPEEEVSDNEETQVAERPAAPDSDETGETQEAVEIGEDHADAEAEAEEEEATQVTERPTKPDDEPEESAQHSDEHEVLVAAPEAPIDKNQSKGVGRHDLPEEFFATNEISGPIFEESARVIDDLAAMEEARQSAGDDVDDGWEAIDDEMDETPGPLGARDTDELEVSGEEETEAEVEDELEEIVVEPLEETPVAAADEWDEDVSQIESEDTSPGIAPIEEFISEGYSMPLPFPVGPDDKDVALGLKRSRAKEAVKDANFPYPKPKKRGEVHARVYYFSEEEPRDLSVPIVLTLVVGLFLIATTFALC